MSGCERVRLCLRKFVRVCERMPVLCAEWGKLGCGGGSEEQSSAESAVLWVQLSVCYC